MRRVTRNKVSSGHVIMIALALTLMLLMPLAGCGSDDTNTSGDSDSDSDTATVVTDVEDIETAGDALPETDASDDMAVPDAEPVAVSGPYATMDAAIDYIESLSAASGPMQLLEPESTWNPDGALHVLHATPSGSASYGGDFYYFFAGGNLVGEEQFTYGSPAPAPDGNTFVVEYAVFLPADPHCCPSGGTATVRFQWDGGALNTLDPMTGATMS